VPADRPSPIAASRTSRSRARIGAPLISVPVV